MTWKYFTYLVLFLIKRKVKPFSSFENNREPFYNESINNEVNTFPIFYKTQ